MAIALEDQLHRSLAFYMRAPEWARRWAGGAYRVLPARWRHGGMHAHFAQEAANHLHAAPWALVEQRLTETLRAAADVPAYDAYADVLRAEELPPLVRLRALPCIGKPELKAALSAYLRRGARERDRLPTFTGGSTAHPMQFHLHRGVTRPKESAYIAAVEQRLLSARPGDWTLSLRGRSVRSAAAGGRLWTVEPIKRHLLFSSDHLEPVHMPGYVRALAELRPPQIHAFPSALHPLALWLHAHPCPSFSDNVRGILLTSENVYGYQLALLREVFPYARVLPHYGHSERVLMATAEPDGGRYRFMPLYGLPEIVDAAGRPVDAPGVLGEIVGTSFDNAVMPFVRYRTGDLGCWDDAPRAPHDGQRTMRRIEGRLQEFVVCRDDRLVSITTLGAAHFDQLRSVDTIQFEQREPGRVDLKVVTRAPLTAGERASIARAVRDKTQGGCEVEVHEVEAIERTPRGKHRMLIQHIDLGRYLGAGAAVPP